MSEPTKNLIERIGNLLYKKQLKNLSSFVGKYVERNGTLFLVVKADKATVTLSPMGSPVKITQPMNTRSFLGKKITIIDFAEINK